MENNQPEYKTAFTFGYQFNFLSGNIDDLVTLEREGCIYSHFWDSISQSFKYYKIKFTPLEIFQYVEAHVAKSRFDDGLKKGLSFHEALKEIKNPDIEERVEMYGNYGRTKLKDGSRVDIRGCLASFFPPEIESLVCGRLFHRYELVEEKSEQDLEDQLINKNQKLEEKERVDIFQKIESVQTALEKGKLKIAFNNLKDCFPFLEENCNKQSVKELRKDFTVISSQFEFNQRKNVLNISEENHLEINRNKIVSALIEMVDSMVEILQEIGWEK